MHIFGVEQRLWELDEDGNIIDDEDDDGDDGDTTTGKTRTYSVELKKTPLGLGLRLTEDVVTEIKPDSQAARDGRIKVGDRVVTVNSEVPTKAMPSSTIIQGIFAGTIVKLEFTSEPHTVSTVTEAGQSSSVSASQSKNGAEGAPAAAVVTSQEEERRRRTRHLRTSTCDPDITWQGVAIDLTVRVPEKTNAGERFHFVCPDQTKVELRCPSPFPNQGRCSWRWHGPGAPAPIDVQTPAGVNAGDAFVVLLPDGRRLPVVCPRPYPPKGVFTVTPPPLYRPSGATHSALLLKTPRSALLFGLTLDDRNRVTAVASNSQAARADEPPPSP